MTGAATIKLGRIGEALLATATDWRIRRLSTERGERDVPDRVGIKRNLIDIANQDVDVLVLALVAAATSYDDDPALITGSDHARYPEERTLSLRWICEQLRRCRAQRVLMVACLEDADVRGRVDDRWLDALATARPHQIVAVDPSGPRALALDAVHDGLCGGAVDPATGTITLRSISRHLARSVPHLMLQASDESQTLASSPRLAGPWDARLTGRPVRVELGIPDDPERLVGIVLPGRFRVDRMLAQGSFGTVYLGRQLAIDRDVAIKVLHGSVDPASEVGRLFVQEIQCVGRIDHPHVVRIFQADITSDGRLFYAMESLAGRDLQQVVEADGVLDRRRAVALVLQLVDALGAAHDAGLVHGDVKPANAFVVPGRDGERIVLLDFGLARLRSPREPGDSVGGTPAYMAPEQLREGRVDSRSDLFSAALVLVTLLTGWRRSRSDELVPSLAALPDPALHSVLARALAIDPAERYQTAAEFAAALGGSASPSPVEVVPPFRHLAPFTEADDGRLHGRERDIATLVDHVVYRRAVIYTAPSGTGKTSLLRAGLIPRLRALGIATGYVACRGDGGEVAGAIERGAATIEAAVVARIDADPHRLVIIIDQLETVLIDASAAELLRQVVSVHRLPSDREVALLLAVREDFLASLMAFEGLHGVPVVRLAPLSADGAREAIVNPLFERRIAISDELVTALLADLRAAVAAIAPEFHWTGEHAAYPPHLQLACSVLYESLGPGEATLGIEHYRRLGGFEAIVGEYLERVLESELPAESIATARWLLLALVTTNHARAFRSETELIEQATAGAGVTDVLETLRARGLVVRLRSSTGDVGWELIHDSVVPRVLAWLDRRDLARRRALELVRHHLRRSRPDAPSLLTADELREVRDHDDAIVELDTEASRRGDVLRATELVARSRRSRHRRIVFIATAGTVVVVAFGLAIRGWLEERADRRRKELLMTGNVGLFELELRPFDWDAGVRQPIPVSIARLPGLDWGLEQPSEDDPLRANDPTLAIPLTRTPISSTELAHQLWRVEARGGVALLAVSHREQIGTAPCKPSIIPIRLPGYASHDTAVPRVTVFVPTCNVTHGDQIVIPAGPYYSGGIGVPPPPFDSDLRPEQIQVEQLVDLPAFQIDRIEVTNAAYAMFVPPRTASTVKMPAYPPTRGFEHAGEGARPVGDVAWVEARAYCRYLGKELPTDMQWEKAMRGGVTLPSGPNPHPRRNYPWGLTNGEDRACLQDTCDEPAVAGSRPGDRSPYGVLDLAGNVQEWTSTVAQPSFVVTRGGNWTKTESRRLATFTGLPNGRLRNFHNFEVGFRCAL